MAWIEQLPEGEVLEIEDLQPLRGGHDPRRGPPGDGAGYSASAWVVRR